MFFDCSALLLGLAAQLITKWKPSEKFTYGFGRAEILAGLANGLFLLFIALFIMKEAIERTFEPPEVHHERLFVISVLGFIVNLVGIFVFQHGGQGGCSHSHHSHSHSHSHSQVHSHTKHKHGPHQEGNQDNVTKWNSHFSNNIPTTVNNKQQTGVVALDMNGYPQSNNSALIASPNGYDHHHHHHDSYEAHEPLIDGLPSRLKGPSKRGQIMQSVFLHIVADTLGSVGVMVSALLMNQFGWMIADPLCSLFIAILISVSVYPLLRDSFYILMQRVPVELENKLSDCIYRIQSLGGVIGVHETHFWTLNSDTYIGCLKLEVAKDTDTRYVLKCTKDFLNQIGVDRAHIQIDQT